MSSILKVDQIQLSNGNTPTAGDLGLNTTGSVIQVAHHKWSTASTSTSTSLSYVSGSSFTFTPKQASSKIWIMADISITQTRTATNAFGTFEINVDGSVVQGSGDNFELGASFGGSTSANLYQRAVKTAFIDATNTNAKTIKLQVVSYDTSNSGQVRVNVSSQYYSAITVMEVAQ